MAFPSLLPQKLDTSQNYEGYLFIYARNSKILSNLEDHISSVDELQVSERDTNKYVDTKFPLTMQEGRMGRILL